MLGGGVVVAKAYVLIVMIPPITRSQKEPRGPAPPVRGFFTALLNVVRPSSGRLIAQGCLNSVR